VYQLIWVHGRALPSCQLGVVVLQAGMGVAQEVAASKVLPLPSFMPVGALP
jgi:hypothetical protein